MRTKPVSCYVHTNMYKYYVPLVSRQARWSARLHTLPHLLLRLLEGDLERPLLNLQLAALQLSTLASVDLPDQACLGPLQLCPQLSAGGLATLAGLTLRVQLVAQLAELWRGGGRGTTQRNLQIDKLHETWLYNTHSVMQGNFPLGSMLDIMPITYLLLSVFTATLDHQLAGRIKPVCQATTAQRRGEQHRTVRE